MTARPAAVGPAQRVEQGSWGHCQGLCHTPPPHGLPAGTFLRGPRAGPVSRGPALSPAPAGTPSLLDHRAPQWAGSQGTDPRWPARVLWVQGAVTCPPRGSGDGGWEEPKLPADGAEGGGIWPVTWASPHSATWGGVRACPAPGSSPGPPGHRPHEVTTGIGEAWPCGAAGRGDAQCPGLSSESFAQTSEPPGQQWCPLSDRRPLRAGLWPPSASWGRREVGDWTLSEVATRWVGPRGGRRPDSEPPGRAGRGASPSPRA